MEEVKYTVHLPNGQSYGPVELNELSSWVRSGIVSRQTPVSSSVDGIMRPAGLMPELKEFFDRYGMSSVLEGPPPKATANKRPAQAFTSDWVPRNQKPTAPLTSPGEQINKIIWYGTIFLLTLPFMFQILTPFVQNHRGAKVVIIWSILLPILVSIMSLLSLKSKSRDFVQIFFWNFVAFSLALAGPIVMMYAGSPDRDWYSPNYVGYDGPWVALSAIPLLGSLYFLCLFINLLFMPKDKRPK